MLARIVLPTGASSSTVPNLVVGDFVGEQRVDLGGSLDARPKRRRTTSTEIPELISSVAWAWRSWWIWISMSTGCGAVLLPPVMRRRVRQRAAATVDGRPEQWARGVAGARGRA